MSLLLERGADVNSKDTNERTALMVAAALGHDAIITVMLAHPLLNIQAGVSHLRYFFLTRVRARTYTCTLMTVFSQGHIGETALQCAVTYRRIRSVSLLLEAGADPSITDYTASSPLHNATGMGQYAYVTNKIHSFHQAQACTPENIHVNLLYMHIHSSISSKQE